jgi:myo-inositol-1(or 4)-monophosphatase
MLSATLSYGKLLPVPSIGAWPIASRKQIRPTGCCLTHSWYRAATTHAQPRYTFIGCTLYTFDLPHLAHFAISFPRARFYYCSQQRPHSTVNSLRPFRLPTALTEPYIPAPRQRIMATTATFPNAVPPTLPYSQSSYYTMSSDDSTNDGDSDSSLGPTPATSPSATPDFTSTLAKHHLTETDIQNIHDLLIDVAKAGGKIMLEAEHEFLVAAATKNNTSDLVTQYDKQVEAMVARRVRAAYPNIGFLGEETFEHGTKLTSAPTFVCDPIDGTLNFSKGVPNCAVSLALVLDKKPVVGVVYNPFRGDMYTAIKNKGSFLTKIATGARFRLPLHPVPPPMPSLRSCLVAIEWGNQRNGSNWELRTDVHKKLLTDKADGGAFCKSVRSNGSAALDFCYVAQGMLDCFWEGGVWIWDVCAGWIVLEEAGGIVASANPGGWNPTLEGRLYFAVRNAKHSEQKAIVEELWAIMGDRKFVF